MKKENTIYKINRFYLMTILWSMFIQFMPIPPNSYQYIAFLPPITIYLFRNREHDERILKPKLLNLKSVILIIITWIFTLPLLVFVIDLYTYFFGDTLADLVTENIQTTLVAGIVFIAITPSILEEVLMRGIILDGYREKSKFVAALMNGLLFGMLHLNSFQFGHTFILGFIASYLVFATNSIFAGMLIHIVNNSFPILVNHFYASDPNMTDMPEVNLLYNILPVIISIFVIYWLIHTLAKINNIDLKKEKETSSEPIFNMPLIISIILFLSFSALLIFTLLKM